MKYTIFFSYGHDCNSLILSYLLANNPRIFILNSFRIWLIWPKISPKSRQQQAIGRFTWISHYNYVIIQQWGLAKPSHGPHWKYSMSSNLSSTLKGLENSWQSHCHLSPGLLKDPLHKYSQSVLSNSFSIFFFIACYKRFSNLLISWESHVSFLSKSLQWLPISFKIKMDSLTCLECSGL